MIPTEIRQLSKEDVHRATLWMLNSCRKNQEFEELPITYTIFITENKENPRGVSDMFKLMEDR